MRAFKGAHPPVYEHFIVLQAATGRASRMIVLGKAVLSGLCNYVP